MKLLLSLALIWLETWLIHSYVLNHEMGVLFLAIFVGALIIGG